MSLKKGQHNSGIKNLVSFPKGKSGFQHIERTFTCIYCGKSFVSKGTRAYYCSESCKEKSRPDSQKKDFICLFCGKPFKRRAKNNAGQFCSRACSGLYKTATGEKSYFYKAFLYLPHKCDLCGNDDFSVLAVHHKDMNHKNSNIDNLQILCANCHYRIHFGNGATRYEKIQPIIEFLKGGTYAPIQRKEPEISFSQH